MSDGGCLSSIDSVSQSANPSEHNAVNPSIISSPSGSEVAPTKSRTETTEVGPRKGKKVAKVKPHRRDVDGASGPVENHRIVGEASGTRTLTPTSKGTSLTPTALPGSSSPIFESGVNTEYIQLLRQLWNVHEEAVDYLERLTVLLNRFRRRVRLNQVSSEGRRKKSLGPRTSTSGTASQKKDLTPLEVAGESSAANLLREDPDAWPSLVPFILGLKSIVETIGDLEKQYTLLSVFQSQCKLVLYAKVLHARKHVMHDQLSILHTVNQLIPTSLKLLSSSSFWSTASAESNISSNLLSVFQLTEVYNTCIEAVLYTSTGGSSAAPVATESQPKAAPNQNDSKDKSLETPIPSPSPSASTSKPQSDENKTRVLKQVEGASRNDSPSLSLSLKPLSATKLLGIFAQTRILAASIAFVDVITTNFLKIGNRAYQYNADPTALSLDKFESCFKQEDSRVSAFAKGFSQTPSLLGRGAVKKAENGEQRVSRSVRTKMYNYFRQTLWSLVGEVSQDLLFWGYDSPTPLALYPVETFLVLRNSLALGGHVGETQISPVISAVDALSSALHSFSLLVSWDEKMRACFDIAAKVKRPEQVALVRHPIPGQWATAIGEKFGDILTTSITLIDGPERGPAPAPTQPNPQSSSTLNPHVVGRSLLKLGGENEEEPLADEAQMLYRLDATLSYYRAWILKRAKSWLNAWAIPQFLACSQRDSAHLVQLLKSRESILITREILLTSENTSIRLSAKQRQMCADDLREALEKLQAMPDELLLTVGPVCNTLSLATFQSHMPAPNHWRGIGPGSGLDPDKASPYVQVFIDRVIEPVIVASVEFVSPAVQEAMGKQAIHAGCEAWLEYILQKRVRFSEWGAVQLLRDFMSLRDWIRNETSLDDGARKSILQLEVLKRCEGVAYLLLRSPGDVLGVGKPSRRTRRVSSNATVTSTGGGGGSGSRESSPSVSESSIADDDIPPEMYVPNQQMWLELRLRRSALSSCCQ